MSLFICPTHGLGGPGSCCRLAELVTSIDHSPGDLIEVPITIAVTHAELEAYGKKCFDAARLSYYGGEVRLYGLWEDTTDDYKYETFEEFKKSKQ